MTCPTLARTGPTSALTTLTRKRRVTNELPRAMRTATGAGARSTESCWEIGVLTTVGVGLGVGLGVGVQLAVRVGVRVGVALGTGVAVAPPADVGAGVG